MRVDEIRHFRCDQLTNIKALLVQDSSSSDASNIEPPMLLMNFKILCTEFVTTI